MTSFVITAYTTNAQDLTNNQYGVVTRTGSLVTTGNSVTSTGIIQLAVLGEIVSVAGSALSHVGAAAYISLSGQIQAGDDGIAALSTQYVLINNAGTILSADTAIDMRLTGGQGDALGLINSGTLQGVFNGVIFVAQQTESRIDNTGTIIGQLDYGITMSPSVEADATGIVTIYNSGTIAGGSGAIIGGFNPLVIRNSGTFLGTTLLSNRDDLYYGSDGTLVGDILGRAGNDMLRLGAGNETAYGGSGNDEITGGAGEDTLVGDEGFDTLRGGDGDDLLQGEENSDALFGGRGADTVRGGDGNEQMSGGDDGDDMYGDTGNDNMRGQDGNDALFGAAGNDTVQGGSGDDFLQGGEGRDLLYGGAGADLFQFLTAAESPNTVEADTIRDFQQGLDLIDLSDVSAQVLVFQGTGNIAGGGIASLRYSAPVGGATRISIDTDGDGVTDMRINLSQAVTLTAADFIL